MTVLVLVNQWHDRAYHWLDDTVFFTVIVGGAAGAGAAVRLRAAQVRRLQRLAAELDEQQRVDVAAARLEEQNRVQQQVHARLAERIAGDRASAPRARSGPVDADAFEVLESEARSVLDQLRAALGSLATPDPVATPDPQPATSRRAAAVPARPRPAGALGVALAIETVVHPLSRGPVWANVLASAGGRGTARLPPRATRSPAVGAFPPGGDRYERVADPDPGHGHRRGAPRHRLLHRRRLVPRLVVGARLAARRRRPPCVLEEVSGLADDGVDGDAGWIVLVWTVAAVVLGRLGAGWQERVRRTADLVAELERGRGAATRLATAQERQALASELHDTVAHAMTVVCVQAGAQRRSQRGRRRHARTPSPPRRPAASPSSATAWTRSRPRDRPLEPSRLAAVGRRVGVDVGVTEPDAAPTGPAASLAFRVVREAIVNVARHSPGAAAEVTVTRHGELAARRGPRPRQRRRSGRLRQPGTGLAGLAQAVAAAGGTLGWGPRTEGGFAVVAEIPDGGTRMTTIVLADDQELVRAGLRMILTAEPDLLGPRRGRRRCRRRRPRALDRAPTSCSWTSGCRASTGSRRPVGSPARWTAVRVVMLTTFDRSQLVYDSLLAGASGFLLKDAPSEQLVSGIRAVVRGEELLAPGITRRLIEEFTRAGRQGPPPGYDRLTEREVEVLELVARGRSNAEIAGELFVSIQTVKTHVARVLAKLGVRDRVQAVVLAYERGLVRPGE